jgi:hypothetical protein
MSNIQREANPGTIGLTRWYRKVWRDQLRAEDRALENH